MKFKRYFLIFLFLVGGIFFYLKLKTHFSGYNNDKFNGTFYGFGQPFSEKLNNGEELNIGPYWYDIKFENYNTPEGEISKAKITGQELELKESGWTIPQYYTHFSADKVEYANSEPIFWLGKFDFKLEKSEAFIEATLKSTISNDNISIMQHFPVIKSKTDFGYNEFTLNSAKDICFDLLIGRQNVKFCNTKKYFVDSMIDLIEKKNNKPLSSNRKIEIMENFLEDK